MNVRCSAVKSGCRPVGNANRQPYLVTARPVSVAAVSSHALPTGLRPSWRPTMPTPTAIRKTHSLPLGTDILSRYCLGDENHPDALQSYLKIADAMAERLIQE